MFFRQLFEPLSSTYTYLLADRQSKQALLIDPVDTTAERDITLLKELGYTLSLTLETHTHADHITGAAKLKAAFPEAELGAAKESGVSQADFLFSDGQKIEMGNILLQALHTPGHTSDSYCFVMNDRVFTGDTLFIRGTGRTDFQNGDALAQYHAITEKLFCLNESTWVYPGHDYNGMTVSTIGEEKALNPRLQVDSAEAYKALMDSLNLPHPKQIDIALPRNLKMGFK